MRRLPLVPQSTALPTARVSPGSAGRLAWVGCTADSHETAGRSGDDITLRAGVYDVERGSAAMLGYLLRRVGSGGSMLHRVRAAGELVGTGGRLVRDALVADCQVTGRLAARLGFEDRSRRCLAQTFTPGDGRGTLAGVRGEQLELPTRIVHLADVMEVHHRIGGADGALAVARERSGSMPDPALVSEFDRSGAALLDGLPAESSWSELLAADGSPRLLAGPALDAGLEAVADFVDLKSSWFAGHSRGVADLAAVAAGRAGLPPDEVTVVRYAGLLHDLLAAASRTRSGTSRAT